MLFHVRIDVRIPHDIVPEKLRELSAQEHERAKGTATAAKVDPSLACRGQIHKHQYFRRRKSR